MGWGQCEIIICKWVLSPVVIRHFGVVQRVELIKSGRSHWTWAIGTHSSAASASCARLLRFAGKSQFAILLPLLHCHSHFPFLSGPKAPTQTKTTAAAGVLLFLLASALFVCCLFSLLSAFALHFSALSFFAFRSCQRTKRAKLWAERAHMLVFVFSTGRTPTYAFANNNKRRRSKILNWKRNERGPKNEVNRARRSFVNDWMIFGLILSGAATLLTGAVINSALIRRNSWLRGERVAGKKKRISWNWKTAFHICL